MISAHADLGEGIDHSDMRSTAGTVEVTKILLIGRKWAGCSSKDFAAVRVRAFTPYIEVGRRFACVAIVRNIGMVQARVTVSIVAKPSEPFARFKDIQYMRSLRPARNIGLRSTEVWHGQKESNGWTNSDRRSGIRRRGS